jgi:hypothetical protein
MAFDALGPDLVAPAELKNLPVEWKKVRGGWEHRDGRTMAVVGYYGGLTRVEIRPKDDAIMEAQNEK